MKLATKTQSYTKGFIKNKSLAPLWQSFSSSLIDNVIPFWPVFINACGEKMKKNRDSHKCHKDSNGANWCQAN
jgi:hypothetical protein